MTAQVQIGFGELPDDVCALYDENTVQAALAKTLQIMHAKHKEGLKFAYYETLQDDHWTKPITLDVYITEKNEAQALNLQARGKDYATNILSYPSDLPAEMLDLLPELPLGELILCHEVVQKEADAQGKTFLAHLTHLLVHGVLHLLGFDHELGEVEAEQMEGFEIEILSQLGVANPYADDEY
nr:rRNA maturation RNase YbeY [Moraxella caviae]